MMEIIPTVFLILISIELGLIWAELYRMGRGHSFVGQGGKPASLLNRIAQTMTGGAPVSEFPTRPSMQQAAASYEEENNKLMKEKVDG